MCLHGLMPFLIAAIASAAMALPAWAGDMPPAVVSRFTRQVQPLIVNRCAAGACHGGPAGHTPTFERGGAASRPDRTHTLANMGEFLDAVGNDRDPRRLVTMLAGRHPAKPVKSGLTAAPLTTSERITIESWLAAVRAAEGGRRFDPAVQQAASHVESTQQRNPFRDLLESAASPQELPPPQEPQGVIFKKDDETSPEPPVAPAPPQP
ncbi:MAG: hypothetical protein K8S94_05865 [Planctomycetia bacterium]|nr:hypothetical protein [Planctomycetia bacterium]